MTSNGQFNLHLVSDASGETVSSVARACLVQYPDVEVTHHLWWLVRTKGQIERVVEGIRSAPGLVIFTLLDEATRSHLETACRDLGVPCVSALDPVMLALRSFLNREATQEIGRQHTLDTEYFERIEAMHFALEHDDGQSMGSLHNADIVVLGVSRTSKTPTCMYLANKGFRAGNIPLVPGLELPDTLTSHTKPFFVGLTRDPKSLTDIRQNRLRIMNEDRALDYADVDKVREEVASARRLFSKHKWPVIDVTRKSIEETAASIMQLYADKQGQEET